MRLIINTRPETTSAALQQVLLGLGLPCVRVPGMAIVGPQQPKDVGRLLHAAMADYVWIFTSINAIEQSFLLLSDSVPASASWPSMAVLGQGSLHCLQQHLRRAGQLPRDIILPQLGSNNSEGLLQHPSLQQVSGQRVLLLNAPGGRDQLLMTLQQRGAQVRELAVYQRVAAQLAHDAIQTMAAWPDELLTLWTSSAAIRFLQQEFAAAAANHQDAAKLWQRIMQGHHLVLSSAQQQILQQLDAVTISLAAAPDNASLARQLQELASA